MKAARRIKPDIDRLLRDLRQRLGTLYGDRLARLVLYGSHARGEATGGSDVDIMIVLRGPISEWEEIKRASDAVYSVELEHEEMITLLPLALNEYRTRQSRFMKNVRREGIAL